MFLYPLLCILLLLVALGPLWGRNRGCKFNQSNAINYVQHFLWAPFILRGPCPIFVVVTSAPPLATPPHRGAYLGWRGRSLQRGSRPPPPALRLAPELHLRRREESRSRERCWRRPVRGAVLAWRGPPSCLPRAGRTAFRCCGAHNSPGAGSGGDRGEPLAAAIGAMSRQRKSSARQLGHPRLLHPWEAAAAATDVALQAAPPALGPACSTPLNRQQSRATGRSPRAAQQQHQQ